jgi:hypothetical protein
MKSSRISGCGFLLLLALFEEKVWCFVDINRGIMPPLCI